MADDRLIIELDADTKKINQKVDNLPNKSKKAGKEAGKSFSSGFESAFSVKGLIAGALSVGAIAAALNKATKAASIQEDAINSLNSSLALTGKYSKETSQDLQNFASELQKNSRFGDEATLQNMALIQSLGNLSEKGLKEATQAAADLSAALKIDLRSAATLVGKAAAGEVGSFSRYGLAIKKGSDNAETFSNALTALKSKFGGAALNDINTYSGATTQLSNSWGDLWEVVGQYITGSPIVIKIISTTRQYIEQFSESIKNSSFSLKDLIIDAINLGLALNEFVLAPIEIIGNSFSAAFDGMKIAIQGVVVGITSALGVIGSTMESLGISNTFTQTITDLSETTKSTLDDMVTESRASLESLFDTSLSDKANVFLENIKSTAQQTGETVSIAYKNSADSVAESTQKAGQATAIFKAGVVGSIAAIGGAMAKNTNIGDAFLKVMLNMFGDILINAGTAAIAVGTLAETIKNAITFFSGAGAIVAGVAAIALGGAMKAFSGSIGNTTPSTVPTTGGGVATETTSTPAIDVTSQQERVAQQGINVNIHGDILGDESAGMKIVELINGAFDTTGASINTRAIA
ncbi:MAG: hypothetical protein OEL89_00330 [Candidatus Peregrinibacteria bacterium]|nr:hypothetical protein [Candidatus Peregrinibacteria bacterium]